ncbi:MAG TPA: Rrf2 family transcriptional regulator, partial [Alphaproteobacteria bacterium]|nr:Rrf2 family transcriptional regulator [Alphaproteobacteria bacterium]
MASAPPPQVCPPPRACRNAELAGRARLESPTVAKVLKLLAKGKVVSATRGASGGYVLERSLKRIAVSDVIAAVDGPVSLTACVSGGKD